MSTPEPHPQPDDMRQYFEPDGSPRRVHESQPAAPASSEFEELAHQIAERFIGWPLPESVCADLCATRQGPDRIGTNLLSYIEAKAMAEQVVIPVLRAAFEKREQALREQLAEAVSERDEWEKTLDGQIKVACDCQGACGAAMLARDKAERELTASRALVAKLKSLMLQAVPTIQSRLTSYGEEFIAAINLTPEDVRDQLAEANKYAEEMKRLNQLEREETAKRDADQIAIGRWQESTGRKGVRPDTDDLVVWLLDQVDAAEAARKRAEERLAEAEKQLNCLFNRSGCGGARSEEGGAT